MNFVYGGGIKYGNDVIISDDIFIEICAKN